MNHFVTTQYYWIIKELELVTRDGMTHKKNMIFEIDCKVDKKEGSAGELDA